MDVVDQVVVATDFSATPGPRGKAEGKFSGDEFLKDILRPRFHAAVEAGGVLLVDLDGTEGYATSFLEACFGGLAREYAPEVVLKHVTLKSDEEPYLIDEIKKYIREAREA